MNRLLNIGFKKVGYWDIEEEKIKYRLDLMISSKNILYAFVCNGEVKYIGKTIQTLKNRMTGHKNPQKSQTTNMKTNLNISKLLKDHEPVDIFALPDNGLLNYGGFHINLAAGLEDDLIKQINPEWNGKEDINNNEKDMEEEIFLDSNQSKIEIVSGTITLQKTYYEKGFINIPVDLSDYVGSDKENMEIYVSDSRSPIIGYINRTANSNKTPRIMGGIELKKIFQKEFSLNNEIKIDIFIKKCNKVK